MARDQSAAWLPWHQAAAAAHRWGVGSDASLLLCLGEAGKGRVVGLLALQGGGAGWFRGQAGGDLTLLDAGEGGRCRLVDEAGNSRLVLGSGTLG
jgi:hypothetical protein